MKKKNKGKKIGNFLLYFLFLFAAAAAIIIIVLSKECGGTNDIKQSHVEIPTTETTTSTTTTTTTTTKATTTTTTDTIDYEMKLDLDLIEEHKAVNPDVVGWIYIDDTVIDYPVLRGENNDRYIHADWTGEYSFAGCIYEDFRGDIEDTDVTLLYGHNMANGSMFSGIRKYLDEEWGKEHKYIEIASEDTRYLYEVISVNILYGESGADFSYWMPDRPASLDLKKSNFEEYVKDIKSTANIIYSKSDKLPKYGDNIIGLQTCNSGSGDGMRCVVFAKCLGER